MCLNKFYKRVIEILKARNQSLNRTIDNFFEIMEHQIHTERLEPDFVLPAIRGLVILIQIPEMENFDMFGIFEHAVKLLKIFADECRKWQNDSSMSEDYKNFMTNFLCHCIPKHEFQKTISKFQNYITLVIIQNIF